MQFTFRPKSTFRSIAAVALASVTALSLIAWSPGNSSQKSADADKGSPSLGTVNWWGWTPTDLATAKGYISAFNQEYPDITVNDKLVSIPDWQAALTPALRSDSGPDVFDIQPGSYVTKYKSFTEDLTPVVTKALGDDWQSKVAPAGVSGLTSDNKLVALSVGAVYSGTLWLNQGLFDKYGLQAPTTLDEWEKVCQSFRSHQQAASSRVRPAPASTRTRCRPSRTRSSRACGPEPPRARRSGMTQAS